MMNARDLKALFKVEIKESDTQTPKIDVISTGRLSADVIITVPASLLSKPDLQNETSPAKS